MRSTPDPRRALWALLGVWIGFELLYISRWWPPGQQSWFSGVTAAAPGAGAGPALQQLLAQEPGARVWFAPYSTFPETGALESGARRGVYDTLLAFPTAAAGGLAANYGASKLTPADTLFSLASASGLAAEWRLAQRLGYGFYALDLGAISDPAAGVALCRRTRGCRLSRDAYALFTMQASTSAQVLEGLSALERRIPQLPYRSSGPSWGPLVFNPSQWTLPKARQLQADLERGTFVVLAGSTSDLEIYRYPLERFPAAVRTALALPPDGVQLVLRPQLERADVCIGPASSSRCTPLVLNAQRRRVAIGALLPVNARTRLTVQALQYRQPTAYPLQLEIRSGNEPSAARIGSAQTTQPVP